MAHWFKIAETEKARRAWTESEDQLILEWVAEHGAVQWASVAKLLPGRMAKACRNHWHDQLDPAIKRDRWSADEDGVLIAALQQFGPKWSLIARLLPGRTGLALKNRWFCSLKRRAVVLLLKRPKPRVAPLDPRQIGAMSDDQVRAWFANELPELARKLGLAEDLPPTE
jgi:hypothetical protein